MVSEYLFYTSDEDFVHVIISAVFLIQLIVAYPTSLRYDGSLVFKSAALNSLILLAFINIIGIFVVYNNPLINNLGIAYHSFFVVASLIFYYFILSNKLIMYSSNSDYF